MVTRECLIRMTLVSTKTLGRFKFIIPLHSAGEGTNFQVLSAKIRYNDLILRGIFKTPSPPPSTLLHPLQDYEHIESLRELLPPEERTSHLS